MADPKPPVRPEPPSQEDRRDSPRVPVRVLVRDPAIGGSFDERPGNLSLGGVHYRDDHPPRGSRLEIRVLLPGTRTEIRCAGEVVRVSRERGTFGTHLRFADLSLEDARAVARLLDGAAQEGGRP
jgi:hypothetical protein